MSTTQTYRIISRGTSTALATSATGKNPSSVSTRIRPAPTRNATRNIVISARGSCGKSVLISATVRTFSFGAAAKRSRAAALPSELYSSLSGSPQRMQYRMRGTSLPHWLQRMTSGSGAGSGVVIQQLHLAQERFAAFITDDVESVSLACVAGDVQACRDMSRAHENPRAVGPAGLLRLEIADRRALVTDLLGQPVELRGGALDRG